MTTSTVTLVGDVSDLIGNDYDPSRTKVWVQHNTDKVVTDSGPIRLGAATKAVASDGTFSFANVVASTSLVENLQATLWVDWPNTAGPERTRRQVSFGPYDLTGLSGTVDIRTLEATQALDPVASSAVLSQAQGYRDDAEAARDAAQALVLSDLGTTDGQTRALVQNPASQTAVALSASFGRRQTTIVVAAFDSYSKQAADFVLTGTDDQETLAHAVDELPEAGGEIILRGGTIRQSARWAIGRCNVTVRGEGWPFWGGFVANPTDPQFGAGSGIIGDGITKIMATEEDIDLIFLDNNGAGVNAEGRLSGVLLSGMYLVGKNSTGRGLVAANGGDYIDQLIVRQMFVHKTEVGMYIDGDCPYLTEFTIMDVAGDGLVLGPAAGVGGQVDRFVIADIGGDGVLLGPGAQRANVTTGKVVRCERGIVGEGAFDAMVTTNGVWGNRNGGIIFDRAAQILGNVSKDNAGSQIKIHDTGAGTHAQQGIIANNRARGIDGNPVIHVVNAPHTLTHHNGVETAPGGNGVVVTGSPGSMTDHNDVSSTATAIQASGYGLFVDADSAAVGAATDNIVRGGFAERFGGGGTNQLPPATAHFIRRDNVDYSGAITDTFTRADSTSSLGVADSGHTWLATTGVWGIASNGAYCVSGAGQNMATVPAVSGVGTVSAKVAGSSPVDQGLAVRLIDGGNYMLLAFSESGTVKLYKVVSNTFTVIGSAAASAPTTGDTMSVTMTSGNLYTVKKNGTTLFTATDAANAAGTRHGFWSFGNAAATVKKWDDFSFQPA